MNKRKSLVEINRGEEVTVVDIIGGIQARNRLEAMGIQVGKKIIKQSAMLLNGPITVRVGGTTVGIGHGIASKIIVNYGEGKE